MKKIIAWILLLIVLAGGVYWINKLSYKASPLVQDSINSTDSWKTYTNEKYGSFKYPSAFTLEELATTTYLVLQSVPANNYYINNISLVIGRTTDYVGKKVSLEENLKVFSYDLAYDRKSIMINNQTWLKFLSKPVDNKIKSLRYVREENGIKMEFLLSNEKGIFEKDVALIEEIVSTFKFIPPSEQSMIPEIPLNPNTEPFSMWKKYTDPVNYYSISHPAEYHMAFGSSLINYDENKYEMGNSKGVKIQIQKIDKSIPIGPIKETKYLGINTEAPGGRFSMYEVIGNDNKVYFRINVWGSENDIHNIINILSSFKFTSTSTPSASIKVLSPNGGEQFKNNLPIKVNWEFSNLPGAAKNNPETVENIQVHVVDRAGKSCMVANNIPVISKTYTINVSSKQECFPLNSGELKVYLNVPLPSGYSIVEDSSDNYFTITN